MGRTIHYTVMVDRPDQITAEIRQTIYEIERKYRKGFKWTCESPDLRTIIWHPRWPEWCSDSKLPADVKPEDAWKIINARYAALEATGFMSHFDIVQKLSDMKLVQSEMPGCLVRGHYPKDNYLTRKGLVRARLKRFGYGTTNQIGSKHAPQALSRRRKFEDPITRCAYTIYSGNRWGRRRRYGTGEAKSNFYIVLAAEGADYVDGILCNSPSLTRTVERSFMFRMPPGSTWDETVALVKNRTVARLADSVHEWDESVYRHVNDPLMLSNGFTKTADNEFNTLTIFVMLLDLSAVLPQVTILVNDEGGFIPTFKCPGVDEYDHHLDLKIKDGRVSLNLEDVKTREKKFVISHYNLLVNTGCMFRIVNPEKYGSHPRFRTIELGSPERNEKAAQLPVMHALEKQAAQGKELATVKTPAAVDTTDDAAALAAALTPSAAMWDMLGYGNNFDGPLGDETGYDLNDKVTFERA